MAKRQIVCYDDITLPYDSSTNRQSSVRPPPAKKRKKHNQKARRVNSPCPQTESTTSEVTERRNRENTAVEGVIADYDEEDSRELTHEEIWDDSALVGAWESAQQEYEMYHGTGKNWKNEPLKKSPL